MVVVLCTFGFVGAENWEVIKGFDLTNRRDDNGT